MDTSLNNLNIVFERPGLEEKLPRQTSRLRRSHSKSRVGCLNCKKKRVKCDEEIPQCSRCREMQLSCEYYRSDKTMMHAVTGPISEEQRVEKLRLISLLSNEAIKTSTHSIEDDGDIRNFLEHFVASKTTCWIGSPTFQRIAQQRSIYTALKAPWLIKTILAFSAAHLSTLHPTNERYRFLSTLFYSESLSAYRTHLNSIPDSHDLDGRLDATFIHSMLAFFHERPEPPEKWCLPGWIPAMAGVRKLLTGSCHLSNSTYSDVWKPLLQEYYDLAMNPPSWAQESHVNTALSIIYASCEGFPGWKREAIRSQLPKLARLLEGQPNDSSIDGHISFIAWLPTSFSEMLKVKESVALLVIGIWCASFSRIEQWWTQGAAQSECYKICAELSGLNLQKLHQPLEFLCTWSGYQDGRGTSNRRRGAS